MADIAYDNIPDMKVRAGRGSYVAADAEQMYGGQLVGLIDGVLTKWANLATSLFIGVLLESVLGDTSADDPPQGRVNENGDEILDVPIAGVDATLVGTAVYCATSNIFADATLTPTTSLVIGVVSGFTSTGRGNIKLLTPTEAYAKV